MMERWPNLDAEAIAPLQPQAGGDPGGGDGPGAGRDRAGAGRSACATEPAGRPSSCCRGRRGSCSRCGRRRAPDRGVRGRDPGSDRIPAARSCGCSGSRSPRSPTRCGPPRRRACELSTLEITTCLRRGEIEIATRYEPAAQDDYDALLGVHPPPPCRHAVLARTAPPSTSRSANCSPGTRSRWPNRARGEGWRPG